MSAAPNTEEFERALNEVGRQFNRDLQQTATLRAADPESLIRDRERLVSELLQNAQSYYKRKDYLRAFTEWEQAANVLESAEFRRKILDLKESHENLSKANLELADLRQALSQRVVARPADVKFIDESHETMNGQVKNVYSHLSQQLRTGRTTQDLGWWPVAAAAAVLAAGFVALTFYHAHLQSISAIPEDALNAAAPAVLPSLVDDTFLEAQRNAMEKQVAALRSDHEIELEGLKRKHAEAAIGDRERVVQLETRLKEAEAQYSELERRSQVLQ